MNPIELIYSWQALLLAGIVYSFTQGVKVGLDLILAPKDGERPTPVPEGDNARVVPPPPQQGKLGPYRTQAAKLLVEPTKRVMSTATQGRKKRKEIPWLDRFVLPGVPLFLGVAAACLVPIRPEVLTEYVSTHELVGVGMYSVYGAWGASVGQFADYTFSKVKRVIEAYQLRAGN